MMNRFLDCGPCDVALPAIGNDQECAAYDQDDSQISDLIIVPLAAADPFDWTGAAPVYIANTINNAVSSLAYAKRLVGEGGIPVPEKNVVSLARNRQFVARRIYSTSFRVKNLDAGQYDFMRAFQEGWLLFRFYLLTDGGKLVGPRGGIRPAFVDADLPLDRERGGKEWAEITLRWESDGDAPRYGASISDADVPAVELEEFAGCPACNFCFPPIANEQDCTNYRQRDSQVCEVIMVPLAADDPFTWDTGEPVYTANAIDNTETLLRKAKRIVGEGGVSVSEKAIISLPRNRQITERRLFTLSLRIKNTGGNQFDFIRQFQCGWKLFRFYYLTTGGRMFGVQGGLKPLFVDADAPLEGGRGSKEYMDLIIQWEARQDPQRWDYTLNDGDITVVPAPIVPPEVMGDEDTGEVWGDETTGEVWGWQ